MTYGDEPPRRSVAGLYALLETWRPPDPMPQQQRRDIAPLTLVYGDQPPPLSRRQVATEPEFIAQQNRQFVVQGEAPPVADQPFTRNLTAMHVWWIDSPHDAQRRTGIAPLALVYGDQPPPLPATALRSIVDQWRASDIVLQTRQAVVQTAPAAADDPPPRGIASLFAMLAAWEQPPPMQLQRRLSILEAPAAAPHTPAQSGNASSGGAAGPMTYRQRSRSPFTEADNAKVHEELKRRQKQKEEPEPRPKVEDKIGPFELDPDLLAIDEDLAIIEALNRQ